LNGSLVDRNANWMSIHNASWTKSLKKSEQHKELSSWGHGAHIIVELYGNQIVRTTMFQEYTTQCKNNKVWKTLIDWSMNWINNLST
jgi:hypothetical protein